MEANSDWSSLGGGAPLHAAQHGLRGIALGLDPGELNRLLELHKGAPQLAGCNNHCGQLKCLQSKAPHLPRRTHLPTLPICKQLPLFENGVLIINEAALLSDKPFKSAC